LNSKATTEQQLKLDLVKTQEAAGKAVKAAFAGAIKFNMAPKK